MIRTFWNWVSGRRRIKDSYKSIFDTPDGQRVLRHIVRAGYVNRSTFVRGDIHETMLREGQRRMALSIIRYAKQDKDATLTVIEENLNEDKQTVGSR